MGLRDDQEKPIFQSSVQVAILLDRVISLKGLVSRDLQPALADLAPASDDADNLRVLALSFAYSILEGVELDAGNGRGVGGCRRWRFGSGRQQPLGVHVLFGHHGVGVQVAKGVGKLVPTSGAVFYVEDELLEQHGPTSEVPTGSLTAMSAPCCPSVK